MAKAVKKDRIVWVMKDRSNGDSHLLWPTYVWMHMSKVFADAQYRDHQGQQLARLTLPEEVSLNWLKKNYSHAGPHDLTGGIYLTKKKGKGKR